VLVGEYKVDCDYIFIGTHVPLTGNQQILPAALFQSKLISYTSYVVGAKLPKDIYPEVSCWDLADPYYYLRIDRYSRFDYAIFGGRDHKTGQEKEPLKNYERLERLLLRLMPEARPDRRWSGQLVDSLDGLPFMGEIAPRQFVSTAYSGNGITFGTLGACMVRDLLCGVRNPWRELYDVRRKRIWGAWDYLRENMDYPYYMVRDQLAGAEANSLRQLKRGEGKIMKINGERVAAYRDEAGKVITVSSRCTHLGCTLHWNAADRSWDCPCHGSRFRPDGAVMAGPAETPLEPVRISGGTLPQKQRKSGKKKKAKSKTRV
jgi:Rieske Fe-S protein